MMNKKGQFDMFDEFNPAAAGLAILSVPIFLFTLKYYPNLGLITKIIGAVISFMVTYVMVSFIAEN